MRSFSLFAVSLLGISLSVPSGCAAIDPSLDPAEFALPAPGTIIEWRGGDGNVSRFSIDETGDYTYTITELVGDRGQYTRHLFCWGCEPLTFPIELERYRDLWPLEVGKSVKFQRRRASDGKVWVHEINVVGTETLDTELGQIDVYVIKAKARGSGTNPWRSTWKIWFAPSIRWGVKSEKWDTIDGKSPWDIISITPPG